MPEEINRIWVDSVSDILFTPSKEASEELLKGNIKPSAKVVEVGDIILYRNNFYEINSRIENQLFMGRDKDYAISKETAEHGGSFSVLASAHLSRVEKLNLIPLRGGKYPSTTQLDGGTVNPDENNPDHTNTISSVG